MRDRFAIVIYKNMRYRMDNGSAFAHHIPKVPALGIATNQPMKQKMDPIVDRAFPSFIFTLLFDCD